jgi:hypothetical protein
MIGYKLTLEQLELLNGKQYADNSYFNPIQDINGDWFIFESEVKECSNEEFSWVKELKESKYIAPKNESI